MGKISSIGFAVPIIFMVVAPFLVGISYKIPFFIALIIDFIATDTNERRKGIASDMIAFTENEFTGFSKLRVGTQISNLPSLRLYEKLNFQICASDYIFHFHHSPNAK